MDARLVPTPEEVEAFNASMRATIARRTEDADWCKKAEEILSITTTASAQDWEAAGLDAAYVSSIAFEFAAPGRKTKLAKILGKNL